MPTYTTPPPPPPLSLAVYYSIIQYDTGVDQLVQTCERNLNKTIPDWWEFYDHMYMRQFENTDFISFADRSYAVGIEATNLSDPSTWTSDYRTIEIFFKENSVHLENMRKRRESPSRKWGGILVVDKHQVPIFAGFKNGSSVSLSYWANATWHFADNYAWKQLFSTRVSLDAGQTQIPRCDLHDMGLLTTTTLLAEGCKQAKNYPYPGWILDDG